MSRSQQLLESVNGVRFPFADPIILKDGQETNCETVFEVYTPMLEASRLKRFEDVAAHRTFNVLPIVEGCYDMGNLSAVARSADALGCGAFHIINTSDAKYKQSSRNSAGAEKWLDVKTFTSPLECIQQAKASGYQVIVTHLTDDAVDIKDVDWTKPTAIVLGNEKHGVSAEVIAAADICAILPMHGMVESFNVSVAAALMLNEARRGRQQALGYHADLNIEEQRILTAMLILRHKGISDQVLQHYLKRPPPQWQKGSRWWVAHQKKLLEEAAVSSST
eukprot:CAMPEP_0206144912 /NCGR_PEP_ID=MMETSP1473-20131121/25873_1 /ASSEMBLY_ACC=CAM_ASM_001109 /TAXON_ID=1461547 /ORGANISM="Stichococcus sp, Strain RCC1054" /LENGTH=277 /DNA_ID=CAMNT_0053540937 /DNA_START=461 /DNA_END=1294 /DNA_ORIENTATION=+